MIGPKAVIHLDRLIKNYDQIRKKLQVSHLMVVVKANAYGHGSVECAKALEEHGCESFAVFSITEAIELRDAGIKGDILIFSKLNHSYLDLATKHNITLNISNLDDLEIVKRFSKKHNTSPRFHVKFDTGMTRLGLNLDEAEKAFEILHESDELNYVETGIRNAVQHIKNFGFNDATLIRNGSLALGGGDASVLDMTQGYAIIANGGHGIKPYVIDSIYDSRGENLYRVEPAVVCYECLEKDQKKSIISEELAAEEALNREMILEEIANVVESYRPTAIDAPELFEHINAAPQAISPQNAYLVQDMMRDVIKRGTGIRARRELGRSDLSGKTGTSNDRRDAWFGGFNADIAAVVWVGYDDSQPLGPREEGSRTALPIWIEFARIALEGAPENQMPMPEGIVSVRINKETGCPAKAGQSNVTFEVFRENNVPDCEQFEDIVDPFNSAAEIDSDINKNSENIELKAKGRHDPCVGIRAVPIGEAMVAIVLADLLLINKINN